MSAAEPTPNRPPRNRYGWIVFFVLVLTASIGVMVFMIWFNLSIQLKPEQFDTAWKHWQEKGPKDYDMLYTEKTNPDDKTITFAVKVRGNKVHEALMDGRPLQQTEEQRDDPRIFRSMDAQFRAIQTFMDMDAKPGAPKVYVTAIFDAETGGLRRYIRRVMGSQQRVEIVVKEFVRR
ncbi:MAG: hypothetical protein EXR98_18905 [Gemmataceae bacterium]|nr:hypothetical protein [Gemmataceae bacterium]